ncbi:Glycosyltransferase involved in cell wall bisynthesis [Streptomyces zhaozhouensis]|uniref:Glycosyltransferase involved in cell wall bisynthesis n=1 Tax=Streptomyces zhaozhouensis TaxID=1300267 RepID=A0A286DYH6_9ACTN|nr:glycosyltransferase family 4 protein [Streptomyces zhaozhouensis]SOD63719.1 Glycosyltransferase involved in cell wall bisynthesis [Streptomyces zhaozhouensis]
MLTVAHLVQPTNGGAARVVADLVRAQRLAGMRPVVLCPTGGTLAREAGAAGARVGLWLAERGPTGNLPWEVYCAGRALRRAAPDVVHLHGTKAGLAGRLALRGRLPTVFQPHAWSFESAGGVGAPLARRWERRAAAWTHGVLCASDQQRVAGERAGLTAPMSVVRTGVDPERLPAGDQVARRQSRAALAAVHGLPQRAPLVVCVGRLTPARGRDVLLRAWPRVRARVPEARLVVVGDGPERAALRRAAGPEVLFTGHTEDAAPWFVAADLVVSPTRAGGAGLAPLEAMAVGRPAVVTDVGGAGELLPPGQAAHCLVPPGEPAALARAIEALLVDAELRAALGRAARHHMRAAGSAERAAGECLAVYTALGCLPAKRARQRRGVG